MDNENIVQAEENSPQNIKAEILSAEASDSKGKDSFIPEMSDFIFALAVFVLGYVFVRWVLFSWQGWGVSVFTTAYLLSASAYLIKKGCSVKNPPALFWFAVTWFTGLSYALWDGNGLEPVRGIFLFCAAVYFVITASGNTLMGKTGNYLLIDGINTVLIVPFSNFINQYVSFSALKQQNIGDTPDETRTKKLPVLLGILFALFMIVWIIPLLERADSGGFSKMLNTVKSIFWIDSGKVIEFLVYFAFSVPAAAYIYGLISGAAHKRRVRTITPESAEKLVGTLRFFQPVTVYIALGAVCGLYVIFILCQIPYLFSAFTGDRPAGWLVYAEYARRGFFELCGISAINLAVITIGNVTCEKTRRELRLLSAFNTVLALVTMLLIAAAFSKMAMYIGVYGLSMPRLLTCVFMTFLASVFIALLVLQGREFSIVRFALVTGSVMLCVFFLINPDAIVVRYNTARYLKGTLSDYDKDILYRAGAAGVQPALEVYEITGNERLKKELSQYLHDQEVYYLYTAKAHSLSVERYTALRRLETANIVNGAAPEPIMYQFD